MSVEKQPPKPSTTPATKTEATPSGDIAEVASLAPMAGLVQRARTAPNRLSSAEILQLQRTVGNRKVTQLLTSKQSPPSPHPRSPEYESDDLPLPLATPTRPGRGLPALIQAKMERAFNTDFSTVSIHPNSPKATTLDARAYTQGEAIHFAPGYFQPDAATGQALIGHELTHVVQQRAGRVQPTQVVEGGYQVNTDPHLEQEAEDMGQYVSRLAPSTVANSNPRGGASASTSVIQGSFTYSATAILDRGGADAKTADNFQVDAVTLPEVKRPPTQYGSKQMAHSVSWTLLRKAYGAIQAKTPKLTAKAYIENYLAQDWKDLEHQRGVKGGSAQKELNAYLDKYKPAYFTTLATASHPALKWHELLQTITTDYFVALNLAPLATHTGFTSELGGSSGGIKEVQPSGHGEPAANAYFAELEKTPPVVVTDEIKATVVKHGKAYWDPGTGMEGGINRVERVRIIWAEYTKAFSRAYPQTWTTFGAVLKKEIGDKTIAAATLLSTTPLVAGASDAGDIEDVNYSVGITISTASQDKLAASHYTLKTLRLPDDRPPTKYGPVGQKSHTVSWTVMIKGLRNATHGQSLPVVLRYLLSKWLFLKEQDWDGMLTTNLIAASDFKTKKPSSATIVEKNKANWVRLGEVRTMITPNIARLHKALGGETMLDAEWVNLVQDTVSDYVEVYQSAPLTTYKNSTGKALGHGEPDSNKVLGDLSQDIVSGLGTKWTEKFQALFKGRQWNGSDATDSGTAQLLVAKINLGTPLEAKELESLKAMVVKELALNYLDAQWNAVKKGGGWDLATAPKEMAMICYEWEESLKGAYPKVWEKYKDTFEGYIDRIELSPELNRQQALAKTTTVDQLGEAGTLKSWMQDRRTTEAYQRGLIAVRSGDKTPDLKEHAAYNQAKTDYTGGLTAVQGGNRTLTGAEGVQDAKKEYLTGLDEIQKTNRNLVGTLAFRQAKEDYLKGISDSRAGNATLVNNLATDLAKNEYKAGLLSIQGGSASRDGTLAFNQAKDDYDYIKGAKSIETGNVALDGSPAFNLAKVHYDEGIVAIQAGTVGPTPKPAYNLAQTQYQAGIASIRGGDPTEVGTPAFVLAKRAYKAGVAAAKAGQVAGKGGNAQGHADYLAGVAAANAGQVAGTGGNATGHADYLAGVAAAQLGQAAGAGGHATGHAAYLAGVAAAHAGQVAGTGGNATGHADYLAGVTAADTGNPAGAGGRAQGHAAYLAGVASARANQVAQPGGHGRGHAAYLAGVVAARAGQPAGTGGQATGHADYQAGVTDAQALLAAGNAGHAQGHADYQQGYADATNPLILAAAHPGRAGYARGYARGKVVLANTSRNTSYSSGSGDQGPPRKKIK